MSDSMIQCDGCAEDFDAKNVFIRETERKHYRSADSEIYEDVPVTLRLCGYCAEVFGAEQRLAGCLAEFRRDVRKAFGLEVA